MLPKADPQHSLMTLPICSAINLCKLFSFRD
jgi:hypothetical protein